MAFVDLTKQLAQQALGDVLRPSDPEKPAGPPPAENICSTILGQVQAMQKALKDDEELVVLFHSGSETVRVLELFPPSPNVVVLIGTDADKRTTRVVSPIDAVQLVCKVMKVEAPAVPVRVRFLAPRPAA